MGGVSAVRRFAPSTTGDAHPGTLLSALLCWLDARAAGAKLILRLEDLDALRSDEAKVATMEERLTWFGLDFDAVERQSAHGGRHRDARDELARRGLLYACRCSRKEVAAAGEWAPDGGWRYPGTCRDAGLPLDGGFHLRWRLEDREVAARSLAGWELRGNPWRNFGDPILWRRVGVPAYHLACVVDDLALGVDGVVRGRDLQHCATVHHHLAATLGGEPPWFHHHLLLLERHGGKHAKFHGAVGAGELEKTYSAEELCGILALAAGLRPDAAPATPAELLADFSWSRVRTRDRVLDWDGERLELGP